MLEGSDRIVFIHFVPGSFGSFLLNCLAYSPSVFLQNKKDIIFDKNGAAHDNIEQFFLNFHSGKAIFEWSTLSEDMQKEYLTKNWEPSVEFLKSDLYYIHRCVIPKKAELIKYHIPESKHIKITIPYKYNQIVIDMVNKKNSNLVPIEDYKFYTSIKNNNIIDGVYDFDISHFIEGTFLTEFDKLCDWLGFEKVDVSRQYEKFKQVNGFNK